ncbi:TadE family protein [Kitasatospora sp. NPDC096147]|uniref:TadE family protein n=1 Tax=Kitasatospora sp. NPDC096147 TaxID=3364093 RepID=UPI00380684CC
MIHRPPSARPGARRGDRGALTLSLALVFPLALFLVFLVVQAALYWYAGQAALTAAREGVEAGRARGGTPESGERRADDFLNRTGELAQRVEIRTGESDPQTFRIAVTVRPLAVVPGFDRLLITREVSAPRERFVPQGGTP